MAWDPYDLPEVEDRFYSGPGPQFPVEEMQQVQKEYMPAPAPEAPPFTMGDFFGQMVGNLQVPRIRSRTPGRRGDIETILGGIGSSLLEGAAQGYGKMRQQGRELRQKKMMDVWKEKEAAKQAERDLKLKGLEKGYDTRRNEFTTGRAEYWRQQRDAHRDERQDKRWADMTNAANERARLAQENWLKQFDESRAQHLRTFGNQLRDDFQRDQAVVGYTTVRANYLTAKAQKDLANKLDRDNQPGAGYSDGALIYAYQRVMEPENPNVVREGEYRIASEAAGKLQKYKKFVEGFLYGDKLTAEGREALTNAIKAQLASRRPAFDQSVVRYRQTGMAAGLPTEAYMYDYPEDVAELAPPPKKKSLGERLKPKPVDLRAKVAPPDVSGLFKTPTGLLDEGIDSTLFKPVRN